MKKMAPIILSLILSIFSVIGTSFLISDSFSFITESFFHGFLSLLLFIAVFFVLHFLITSLYHYFDRGIANQAFKKNLFTTFFYEHPFITSLLIILICWLPYIIAFYPGIMSPDPYNQIKMFFNIPNKYSTYAVLIDESQIITNHHPYLHTLLIGGCVKLGRTILNDNFGFFIYTFLQTIFLSCTLAFSICTLKKLGLKTKYLLVCLMIYSLVPVFPMYAISLVKDVYFAAFLIWFISLLALIFFKENKIRYIILLGIMALLLTLVRNNGIYVVIFTLISLIFIKFKNKKQVLITLLVSISLFYGYDKVLLKALKVTPGSVREMLSIPFQQTARLVLEHEDKITDNEKKAYDQVLNYDTLKIRYDSELSDPVKNEFNPLSTKKDLVNYFEYWFKGFFKAPVTYVEATISNTYGYFYPVKTNWYIYYKEHKYINRYGFKYHYVKERERVRDKLTKFAQVFPYIPVVGLIVNIGLNTWIILILGTYLLTRKKYHGLVLLVPNLTLILVMLASPANCYFRYALPNIFIMPLIYGIIIMISNQKKEESK